MLLVDLWFIGFIDLFLSGLQVPEKFRERIKIGCMQSSSEANKKKYAKIIGRVLEKT